MNFNKNQLKQELSKILPTIRENWNFLKIVFLVVLILTSSYGVLKLQNSETRHYTIKGDIFIGKDDVKPRSIIAETSRYDLGDGEDWHKRLVKSDITWRNETHGTFTSTFRLSYPERIHIDTIGSKLGKSVQLRDKKNVYHATITSENVERDDGDINYIKSGAKSQIDYYDRESGPISGIHQHYTYQEEYEDLKEESPLAILEAKQKLDENKTEEAYVEALRATAYLKAAEGHTGLSEFDEKLQESNWTDRKFETVHYNLPKKLDDRYSDCVEDRDYYVETFNDEQIRGASKSELKTLLEELEDRDTHSMAGDCETTLHNIRDHLKYQRTYVNEKIGFLAVFFISSITLGVIFRNWLVESYETIRTSLKSEISPNPDLGAESDLEYIKTYAIIVGIPLALLKIDNSLLRAVGYVCIMEALALGSYLIYGIAAEDEKAKKRGLILGAILIPLTILTSPWWLGLAEIIPQILGALPELWTINRP